MKNSIIITALSIASIIAIAGCTGIPNLFGGDVVSVQTKIVENGVRDVITVKDVQTIPRSPLLPDQSMLLTFIVENRDSTRKATAYVDLFNAPTMHSESGTLCNLYTAAATTGSSGCNLGETCKPGCSPGENVGSDCSISGNGNMQGNDFGVCCWSLSSGTQLRYCNPDTCGIDKGGCEILPHEEKPINYNLKTPSQEDIKNIKTDVKLNFKVGYSFSGALNMLVPAVNMDEIIKRQRSGDKTELAITKSYSSGPIQIDAEIQGAPYIISNVGGAGSNIGIKKSPESVILFTLRDKGSGDLVRSGIRSGAMHILFPPELEVSHAYEDDTCPGGFAANDKFCCSASFDTTGRIVCTNNRMKNGQDLGEIPLYLKESRSSLRFAVSTPTAIQEPFRSFQITSDVSYDYEIRGSADVSINPFQNV